VSSVVYAAVGYVGCRGGCVWVSWVVFVGWSYFHIITMMHGQNHFKFTTL